MKPIHESFYICKKWEMQVVHLPSIKSIKQISLYLIRSLRSDYLHLYQCIFGKRANSNARASRSIFFKILSIDSVYGSEVIHIFQEDSSFNHIVEREARFRQ